MRMIRAFRWTWLPGVILLLSAATGWAQAGNVSTAAQQDLTRPRTSQGLPGPTDDLLAKLESIYKDIHANPELSMQEQRTAGIAAAWLRQYGYEVTEKIGGTGVVGLLRNGEGATGPAARRHGRVAHEGEQRPSLCEHQDWQGARPARRPLSRTPAGTTCTSLG